MTPKIISSARLQAPNPPTPPPPPTGTYRGTDGLWRFPNGDFHPRNLSHLYDSNGRIRESNPPRVKFKGVDGLWQYLDGHLRIIYVTDGPIVYSDADTLSSME